jgi:hypothetical protein
MLATFGWGGESDAVGNQIEKATRYRARIRFIASNNEEQTYRLGLRRTTVGESHPVAVFTEHDLNF